ncbi:MAG: alpha/beta hydrolase [Planctomycetes bacterium]|nr:alpha/beta hydrolase [Planctomycetota bacterium]
MTVTRGAPDSALPPQPPRGGDRPCQPGTHGTLTTSCGVLQIHRSGSGRRLVLLHDLGSDHRSFQAVSGLLAPSFHLVAPDLLGHGGSEKRVRDLSLAAQARALLDAVRDLGLEGAVLVGHSFGGAVALRAAAEAPEAFAGIVLLSAGSSHASFPLAWRLFRPGLPWLALRLLGGPGAVRGALEAAGASVSGLWAIESWEGWAALGRAWRQAAKHGALEEAEELVETSIGHRTLVLWGSEDRLLPASAARVLFRQKRGARFVEIAGARHAVHEDQPGIVAELIREFLG